MSTSRDLKGRAVSDKKSISGFLWLLAGLLIGLFLALLVYLQKQPAEEISLKEAVIAELEKVKANNQASQAVDTGAKEKTEPRFDFYTILPELEVFIPESEIATARKNPAVKENMPSLQQAKRYLLQVGSFRSSEDAERLKASLALLGLQSHIKTVDINKDSWHRVRLGPFNDLGRLQDTLRLLKDNNIHGMTMELKD